MSLETHLAKLESKHRAIDAEIEVEQQHAAADDTRISNLKRQKLQLKDAITKLRQGMVGKTIHNLGVLKGVRRKPRRPSSFGEEACFGEEAWTAAYCQLRKASSKTCCPETPFSITMAPRRPPWSWNST
jgi:hypothetical protein